MFSIAIQSKLDRLSCVVYCKCTIYMCVCVNELVSFFKNQFNLIKRIKLDLNGANYRTEMRLFSLLAVEKIKEKKTVKNKRYRKCEKLKLKQRGKINRTLLGDRLPRSFDFCCFVFVFLGEK